MQVHSLHLSGYAYDSTSQSSAPVTTSLGLECCYLLVISWTNLDHSSQLHATRCRWHRRHYEGHGFKRSRSRRYWAKA